MKAEDKTPKARVPAYQGGGIVEESGIALVHKGEYIQPAEGSQAVITPAATEEEKVVNYYFPVEIEVIGGLSEQEQEAIEARIWEKLSDAIEHLSLG